MIATHTTAPYPSNDTSSFIIVHKAQIWAAENGRIDVGGWFYVNSDSINDYGFHDVSIDNGGTWISSDSLIKDYCNWGEALVIPFFTGDSNEWKYFNYCYDKYPSVENYGDTILYRFTFISDSIQTNKDGLMFDNLEFVDFYPDKINEVQRNDLISIYPNPVTDRLLIHRKQHNQNTGLQVFDYTGNLKMEIANFNSDHINVGHLPKGMYILKYFDKRNIAVKKFIVN